MKEKTVSFEVAKLLKQLGFDWKCTYTFLDSSEKYTHDLQHIPIDWNNEVNSFDEKAWVSAPTQALAQKFIEDKFSLFITTDRFTFENAHAYSFDVLNKENKLIAWSGWTNSVYRTNEEALEAGIQSALEYLKSKL